MCFVEEFCREWKHAASTPSILASQKTAWEGMAGHVQSFINDQSRSKVCSRHSQLYDSVSAHQPHAATMRFYVTRRASKTTMRQTKSIAEEASGCRSQQTRSRDHTGSSLDQSSNQYFSPPPSGSPPGTQSPSRQK